MPTSFIMLKHKKCSVDNRDEMFQWERIMVRQFYLYTQELHRIVFRTVKHLITKHRNKCCRTVAALTIRQLCPSACAGASVRFHSSALGHKQTTMNSLRIEARVTVNLLTGCGHTVLFLHLYYTCL